MVGEGGKFATEEELENYIRDCCAPYCNYPGFYGVQLFDEPEFGKLKEYAHTYRAIKKVFPDMAVQCNLLNLCAPHMLAENPSDKYEDYANYLEYFAKESGIDYLMTDEYAFRRNNIISSYTLPTYQILAKKCQELGLELRLVMQSFSQEGAALYNGQLHGGVAWRRMTEKDMYWQMNLAMGFGCKEFSFFTPLFTIDYKGWEIEGDWFEWDYSIFDSAGDRKAVISKELFNWTDTYSIDVRNEDDALAALALVIAIDAEKEQRN